MSPLSLDLPLRTGCGMFCSSKNLPTNCEKIVIAIGVVSRSESGPTGGGGHGRVRWEVWYQRD